MNHKSKYIKKKFEKKPVKSGVSWEEAAFDAIVAMPSLMFELLTSIVTYFANLIHLAFSDPAEIFRILFNNDAEKETEMDRIRKVHDEILKHQQARIVRENDISKMNLHIDSIIEERSKQELKALIEFEKRTTFEGIAPNYKKK